MIFDYLPNIIFYILSKMFKASWVTAWRNTMKTVHRNQIVMRNILSFIITIKITECNIVSIRYADFFMRFTVFLPAPPTPMTNILFMAIKLVITLLSKAIPIQYKSESVPPHKQLPSSAHSYRPTD